MRRTSKPTSRRPRRPWFALALLAPLASSAGCAESTVTVTEEPTEGGGGGAGGAVEVASSSKASSSSGGPMVTPQACPEGTFATGFDAEGTISCTALDEALGQALEGGCSLHFGWRDSCDNCMEGPSKWGRVDGSGCANGEGADATCLQATLGGSQGWLYGVSTDGNVNGDDKFYVGLSCPTLGESASPGPCEPGEVAVGWNETGFHTCYPLGRIAARTLSDHCAVYLGWRDSCDGCTEAPSKWGRATPLSCANAAGDDGTCQTPLLAGRWVTTLGINTDGDVNGDDKFYAGIHCGVAEGAKVDALGECPLGTALVAIEADASLVCAPLAPAITALARKRCRLTLGWRDSCNGCNEPPVKWGRANTESCELVEGSDSSCVTAVLDGVSVPLVALSTDGDVNGDDKFYAGFSCAP